jgi:hypothetical protein
VPLWIVHPKLFFIQSYDHIYKHPLILSPNPQILRFIAAVYENDISSKCRQPHDGGGRRDFSEFYAMNVNGTQLLAFGDRERDKDNYFVMISSRGNYRT